MTRYIRRSDTSNPKSLGLHVLGGADGKVARVQDILTRSANAYLSDVLIELFSVK